MTKILATLGPASTVKNLQKFIKYTDIIRLNMSHNSIVWHKQILNKIRTINNEKLVLVDIPGVKPRTLNKNLINIKKGQIVKFSYNLNKKNIIPLSNPLPKVTKKPLKFSLSDGSYEFKFLDNRKNILTGISDQNFVLKPNKGLNIPGAIYNDKLQEKVYLSFLKKINKLKFNCVGLSFIQNSKILKILKKKYPEKLFISKIENSLGYHNRKEIIKLSDAIMIDRGDLSAEVGITNLTNFSENIITDSKSMGKPVIIATENLNSLMYGKTPSKSDVVNIDYYLLKKVDFIMLSDETATSLNWLNTLIWLKNYLNKKLKFKKKNKILNVEEIIKDIKDESLVIFSKKGYFYNKISSLDFKNLFLFTENKKLNNFLKLRDNFNSKYVKYPKKSLDDFLYKNIKNNLKLIFKYSDYAYLINVIFPRKNSRANSVSIIQKKDFKFE